MSLKETAQRWGVSTSRVAVLAKQGRIPGAKKIDCRWIIPFSAEKPSDGRADRYTRKNGFVDNKAVAFHFPLLLYMGADTSTPPPGLSDDELALHHAQAMLDQGQVTDAYTELKALVNRPVCVHVKAGALCSLTTCCMLQCLTGEAKDAARSLHALLEEDIPHRQDLLPLLSEVDTLMKGRGAYMSPGSFCSGYRYHPTTLTYLSCHSSSAELLKFAAAAGRYPLHLVPHDVMCARFEDEGLLYAANHMHSDLSFLHEYAQHEEASLAHFQRNVELSGQLKTYVTLSIAYALFTPEQQAMISGYSEELSQKVSELNQVIGKGFRRLNESKDPLFDLDAKEMQLVRCAMRGITNRQIAQELGVSEVTVSKRFQMLFEKTGLRTKKELTELFARAFNLGE